MVREVWNLYRGDQEWKLCRVTAVVLYTLVAGALSGAGAILVFLLSYKNGGLLFSMNEGLLFLSVFMAAAAVGGYTVVSSRAARPREMHRYGLTLVVVLLSWFLCVLSEVFLLDDMCMFWSLTIIACNISYAIYKAAFFFLMQDKMQALSTPVSCCVQAHRWGRGLVVCATAIPAASAMMYSCEVVLVLQGSIACADFPRMGSTEILESELSVAAKVIMLFLALVAAIGIVGFVFAGFGMVAAAWQLMRSTILKLAERQVSREELSSVEAKLRVHLLGVIIGVTSTQLAQLCSLLVGLNLLGERLEEVVVYVIDTLDLAGDILAIMLLSGIAPLLIREDAAAADIGVHIRGLLHSAILTSRAEMVFEGCVDPKSQFCVASFPGKYLADWHALTWESEHGHISSACVFLPRADPQHRFGKHLERPETPGKCWCCSLYGKVQPWGCLWFKSWMENVERAVDLGLPLVAVFFPGQAGKGVVQWEELSRGVNLWDGLGLGGSQKAEVAYLKMRGFKVIEVDLDTMRRCILPGNAHHTPLLGFTRGS